VSKSDVVARATQATPHTHASAYFHAFPYSHAYAISILTTKGDVDALQQAQDYLS
jgi:hypothetical protein